MTKGTSVFRQWQMPAAALVWLVTTLLLILFTYNEINHYAYAALGLLVLLFFAGTDRLAFFFYVLLTIGTVFSLLFLAFRGEWKAMEQAAAIGLHFLFLVHLFALYSIAKYVYQYRTENERLREQVLLLEDYISEEGVLTKHEFEKQAASILSMMRRRKEPGYFIKVDLSGVPRHALKKAMLTTGSALHQAIRKYYDIAGQYDSNTLIILAQNTNRDGLQVIERRIKEKLSERLEEKTIAKLRFMVEEADTERTVEEQVMSR